MGHSLTENKDFSKYFKKKTPVNTLGSKEKGVFYRKTRQNSPRQ